MWNNLKKYISLTIVMLLIVAMFPGTVMATGKTQIVLGKIDDQELEIYPDLSDIKPTVLELDLNPGDAIVTATTSSDDKVSVSIQGTQLTLMPLQAGTTYVNVEVTKEGYLGVQQTFAVHVVEKRESGNYDWSGDAKIGGSGYVTGSVYSKIEENVLYAKTDIGGAYRYDFESDYWIGLNDDATDHSAAYDPTSNQGPGRGATFVISIMPDPVTPGRVYMAAGNGAANAAFYRSNDYGDNWERFPVPFWIHGNDSSNRSTGERISIDPNDNSILYFASQQAGVWKSTDYGENWIRITTDGPTNFRPTFVAVDPTSGTPGNGSRRILVGTTGSDSNTPPVASSENPMRHRPYHSVFVSEDAGQTFTEMPNQPDGNSLRTYGGFVAMHYTFDWDGKFVVSYAEFGQNYAGEPNTQTTFNGVGSNSNFAKDGRVYRFDLANGYIAEDISPQNIYTAEHPAVSQEMKDAGQIQQRGGISGIAVDAQRPGVMVASTFHRHANYSEEVVYYTNDYGANWKAIHSEVVGKKDLRGYGYVDKDNGWGAAVHWAFNIQINPYDSNNALFTTGNGFWTTKNLTDADSSSEITWGFWNDGLEETVIWNLYSPTQTEDYLFSTYADWGSMSWGKDYTISPKNSTVNLESPAMRVQYDNPAFDANGEPNYLGFDQAGKPLQAIKEGYYERWMDTQNLDYAGLKQNVMVLTPSGNYQNTNISAGAISFDEGKNAVPFAPPSGTAAPGGTSSAGWIAISADANIAVWSVVSQNISTTYWADISAGKDSAVVGSSGDRDAWTKTEFYNKNGDQVTSGAVKIFSDKQDPNVFYAFGRVAATGGYVYVSTDKGRTFRQIEISGDFTEIPNVNWNTAGHSQGQNKILVDVFNTRSIYLASDNATYGLLHLTYDESQGWKLTATAVGSSFRQVGMGLGIGDNSSPALYAMGVIEDTVNGSAPYYGAYRSLDGGVNWVRVNDNEHQFGDLRALSGDSRVFGRVYIGTGSRGIRVGDIIWDENTGSADTDTVSPTKSLLEDAVNTALALQSDSSLDNMMPLTVQKFNDTLQYAQEILNLVGATQSDIDIAYDDLMEATSALRQKANKEVLAEMIAKAQAIDLSLYTKESGDALNEAVAAAVLIMDNDQLSKDDQQRIDDAASRVKTAIDNLVLLPDGAGPGTPGSGTVTINGGTDNKGAPNGASTGDTNVILPMLMVMVFSFSAISILLIKKRKSEK